MTTTSIDFAARGREILDFAATADREAWQKEWNRPTYAIGEPEDCWTQFTLTTVADFDAELGFLVDALGLDVFMLQTLEHGSHRMAMLAPVIDGDASARRPFIIGIREADGEHSAAAPGTVQHEFMTKDLASAWSRITAAGAQVVREPWSEFGMERATVRTPSGLDIQLWSMQARG